LESITPTFRPAVLIAVRSRSLRDASQQALASFGYDVLVTDDGRAALAYLKETAVPPDLVVADTKLADIGPSVLADAAWKRGARCLPLASNRFQADRPSDAAAGFNLPTLVTNIQETLGARAVFVT
jgi:CheY-like chemotaxis protein